MIRFGLGCCLAWLLLADAPWADPLRVRSGEHGDFTRLVVSLPDGAGWSVETGGSGASLRVDLPGVQYDTSEVFDRIPRTRLTSLVQSEPGAPLRLEFGCSCEARAFAEAGALLVIDISDDPAARPARFAAPRSEPEGTPDAPLPLPLGPGDAPFAVARAAAPPPGPGFAGSPPEPAGHAVPATAAESRLVDQIRRAADQHLVTLTRAGRAQTDPAEPAPVTPPDPGSVAASRGNISVATVLDRDHADLAGSIGVAAPVAACPPDEQVAVADWSDGRPFPAQIGSARSRLYGEFDIVDPAAALALARTYVHFGFGAEAGAVRAALGTDPGAADPLWAIADVIAGRDSQAARTLSRNRRCDGDVAMWAFLSAPATGGDVNLPALARGFVRLPEHLRALLGPRLADKLTQAGHSDAAGVILRSAGRAGADDVALGLAAAGLARQSGDADGYEATLDAVLQDSADTLAKPRALAALVEQRWRTRGGLGADQVVLAAGFASQFRDGDLAEPTLQAHVTAMILSGDFAGADQRLNDTQRPVAAALSDRLRLRFFDRLAERAGDLAFLRYTLDERGPLILLARPDLRYAIAARLLDLGFPGDALRYLRLPAIRRDPDRWVELKAAAMLAADRPEDALVQLEGQAGAGPDKLRADALQRLGRNLPAGRAYRLAGETERAQRAFWLAGDAQIVDDAESGYGLATELSAREGAWRAPPEIGRLADARELAETSARTRSGLRTLLDGLPSPAAAD